MLATNLNGGHGQQGQQGHTGPNGHARLTAKAKLVPWIQAVYIVQASIYLLCERAMKIEIKVPAMGESISQATIGTILKPNGAAVAIDEELLELETDKVNQVLYAPKAGIFQLAVNSDEVVKIGQIIGYIDTEMGSALAPKTALHPPHSAQAAVEKGAIAEPPSEKQAAHSEPPPTAVRQGECLGVRQSREEVLQSIREQPQRQSATATFALEEPAATAAQNTLAERCETKKRLSNVRKVIAQRLVAAKNETAMLTTFNEVDLTEVIALRERCREEFTKKHGVRLGFMSFFIKAAVEALKSNPQVNAYLDGDFIVYRQYYDIGVAVSSERGLFVPVLRQCDQLSFATAEKKLEEFAKKAREGSLAVDDLQGGGFTITNGGVFGSLLSTPILNPPQCAILGMHKIQKRPVAINENVVIRPMMYLALSYDHRLIDGKEAVTFLIHIKNTLEDPTRLLLEL